MVVGRSWSVVMDSEDMVFISWSVDVVLATVRVFSTVDKSCSRAS